MLCEEVLELMMPYFDKELKKEETILIEEHLKNCATCREEFNLMRNILSESGQLGANPPKELREGVMKKIKAGKRRTMFKALPAVAAAAVVVLAIGLNFNQISSIFGNKKAARNLLIDGEITTAEKSDAVDDNAQNAPQNDTAYSQENGKASMDYSADVATSKSTASGSVGTSSAAAVSPEDAQFAALPFGVKKIYRIDETESFKYGVLVDYSTGISLTKRSEIKTYSLNKPPLLVTKLSLAELEKILKESSITVLGKSEDYKTYPGLSEKAEYGFIMLDKQSQ